MNKILRTFHPVGQGAFYSERHSDFNIVYDCGNWKNSKAAQKVVNQAFDKNDTIDILFISHFDYDHVSMIGTLRDSVKSIQHVVLPLLHDDDEKILLKAFNHLHANSAILNQLIDDPRAFFGDDTRLVFVNASDNSESPINDNQESINLENLSANQTIIDSGAKIQLNTSNDWIFIPHNYENTTRSKMLKDALIKEKISIPDLENVDFLTKNSKKIKGIYEKIDGNINENSMIVYSGPLHENHHYHFVDAYYICLWDWHYLYRYHHYVDFHDLCHKPACIYSGDADFNKVQIHNIFQQYWENVGTIQVPHHGSKNSFDFSSGFHTQQESFICPVSFGTNNTYGHPSGKVLEELIQYENIPIAVTEKKDSTFIEIIDC